MLTRPLTRVNGSLPIEDHGVVGDGTIPWPVSTVEAVRRERGSGDGLLHRYPHTESPDGLPGQEGASLLCSSWLVDDLTGQGRLDEAHELYASLCGRATALGLLAEEVDPGSGAFLGNSPQAFSHVGVISSGWTPAHAEAARR